MNISIVIPARNDLDNLRKCISYLEASTIKPFEILVVDDASEPDLSVGLLTGMLFLLS